MKNLGKFILLFSSFVMAFAIVSCNHEKDGEKMVDIASKDEIIFSDGDYELTQVEYIYGEGHDEDCKTADVITTDFYEATFEGSEVTTAKKSTKMVFATEESKVLYLTVKESQTTEEGVTKDFDDENYTVTITYENPISSTSTVDAVKAQFFPESETGEKKKVEISDHYAKQTEDASKMEYGYLERIYTRTSESAEWEASSPYRHKITIEKK